MSTIGELAVNVAARTSKFDRNIGKSADRTKQFGKTVSSTAKQTGEFGKSIKNVVIGLASLAAARSTIALFAVQEQAERKLAGSLRIAGDESATGAKRFREFASEIQNLTVVGDEAVLEMGALGAAVGGLTGVALENGVRAAIGLSEAWGIDVVAAMKLVARAAMGDVTALKRYGVTVDSTLSKQEKLNVVLELGANFFQLATDRAKTASGQYTQFKNRVADLGEKIGGVLLPPLNSLLEVLSPVLTFVDKNASATLGWSAALLGVTVVLPKIIKLVASVVTGIRTMIASQILLTALSGPRGWAIIAAGIVVAGAALAIVNQQLDDTATKAKGAQKEMAKLKQGANDSGQTARRPAGQVNTSNLGIAGFENMTREQRATNLKLDRLVTQGRDTGSSSSSSSNIKQVDF